MLDMTIGRLPELSVITGAFQFTLIWFSVAVTLLKTISAGQDTKVGASVSKITIKSQF